MLAIIFCAVALTLHFLKKSRLSSLWAMLVNVMLLPSSAVSTLGIFLGAPSFLLIADIIGTIGCLLIFIYQNIAPSDPLSFRKNYSESAERLVGCRRLTVSGLVASTWGIISSVSGMAALLSANSLFWGLEGETLRAATIATMGFNFIFGAISALISIVLTATGICRLICGEIMLINGLLRSVRELYKNSDKAVALSVLSCIPAANIAAAAIILKKVQSGIKSGTLTQCDK